MARLRVNAFAISLDGFGAGPRQSAEAPLGAGGLALHDWAFPTRSWRAMHGLEGGETGADDHFLAGGLDNVGAWIMGRNMFGPVRGPWPDESWNGWWGEAPPFHAPVVVLTHHARDPLRFADGTVFHFATGGIFEAVDAAFAAADGRDVLIGGGVATVRQYLEAHLIDEMRLAVAPVLLGGGESLFAGLDLNDLGYEIAQCAGTAKAAHFIVRKRR